MPVAAPEEVELEEPPPPPPPQATRTAERAMEIAINLRYLIFMSLFTSRKLVNYNN